MLRLVGVLLSDPCGFVFQSNVYICTALKRTVSEKWLQPRYGIPKSKNIRTFWNQSTESMHTHRPKNVRAEECSCLVLLCRTAWTGLLLNKYESVIISFHSRSFGPSRSAFATSARMCSHLCLFVSASVRDQDLLEKCKLSHREWACIEFSYFNSWNASHMPCNMV